MPTDLIIHNIQRCKVWFKEDSSLSQSPSSSQLLHRMLCPIPHQTTLILLRLLAPPIERSTDMKIKSNLKETPKIWMRTGQEISITESTQKRRPWPKHRDAWSVLIVHAKKHAPQALISGPSFTKSRTKTTTAQPRLSYPTILSAYLAVDYVQSVSSAHPRATLIGLKEVQFKLVSSNNSPAKFLRKWK